MADSATVAGRKKVKFLQLEPTVVPYALTGRGAEGQPWNGVLVNVSKLFRVD